MCIIAIKEKGVAMPDLETLNNMWNNNPDGAGYMFPFDGKVHIRKGFMKLKELTKDLDKLAKQVDIKETPIIMHFRIGTHGVHRNPANTHPFPVSASRDELKALRFETNVGFAHNGIISSMDSDSDISDTMMYSVKVLSAMKSNNRKFYKNKHMLDVIRNTIEGSRMVFMDGSGYISRVGNWVTDEKTGMIYSNSTYVPYLWDYSYTSLKSLRKTNTDMWESYLGAGTTSWTSSPEGCSENNFDIEWDGRYFIKLSSIGNWVELEDGTEMLADEYAEYIGAELYTDEFGLAYAYIKGEGMMELSDVYRIFNVLGESTIATWPRNGTKVKG